MAVGPWLPEWAGTRKVTPIWILLKQETVSGSGISWAICKSASRSRQTTTPAPHHSSILQFLQARCPSYRPTNSVKALKAQYLHRPVWYLLNLDTRYCTSFMQWVHLPAEQCAGAPSARGNRRFVRGGRYFTCWLILRFASGGLRTEFVICIIRVKDERSHHILSTWHLQRYTTLWYIIFQVIAVFWH